jgi:hypothetical protein
LADTSEGDLLYLHAAEFAKDVVEGFDRVWKKTRTDAALRQRMLQRFDEQPPVGPTRIPDGLHGATLGGSVSPVSAVSASAVPTIEREFGDGHWPPSSS